MSQSNQSEKKKKQRKNNPYTPAVAEGEKKLSRDARRKQLYQKETEVVTTEKPKNRFVRFFEELSLNRFTLKVFLLLATTCGCLALVMFDPVDNGRSILRGIGNMAIPLAVFLCVETYYKTKSRAGYIGRLVFFGILAQLPYFYLSEVECGRIAAMHNKHISPFEELSEEAQFQYIFKWQEAPMLNFLFTLLLILLFVWLMDLVMRNINTDFRSIPNGKKALYSSLLILILIIGVPLCALAQGMKLLESPILALMIAFPSVLFRKQPKLRALSAGIIGLTFCSISGPTYGRVFYAIGGAFPAVLYWLYDGSEGRLLESKPRVKYAFYVAYATIIACTTFAGMILFVSQNT